MNCSVDSCDRPQYGRKEWCRMHFGRWKRHGDPTFTKVDRDPERRFKNQTAPKGECVVWTGYIAVNGYASFLNGGKRELVHRYSYSVNVGPIPEGMQVDHICHNRACVKPQHLRLATGKQNNENQRGAQSRSKTGIRGVTWDRGMWRAVVGHNGQALNVGRFQNIADAEAAAIAKRNELFTHNDYDRNPNVQPADPYGP